MGIPQTRFVKGDWNADCDECGFTFKASELRRRWDGAMVCKDDYETRHPQDLLRSRKEKGGVPWARPQEAIVASDYTDPITGVEETTEPTALYATFGPVDPNSL
jgi:hypothetical protein